MNRLERFTPDQSPETLKDFDRTSDMEMEAVYQEGRDIAGRYGLQDHVPYHEGGKIAERILELENHGDGTREQRKAAANDYEESLPTKEKEFLAHYRKRESLGHKHLNQRAEFKKKIARKST